jgi:hypothetical protein
MARSDPGDGRFCGCDGVDVILQWRVAGIGGKKIMPLAPLAANITGKAASQAWSASYKNLAPSYRGLNLLNLRIASTTNGFGKNGCGQPLSRWVENAGPDRRAAAIADERQKTNDKRKIRGVFPAGRDSTRLAADEAPEFARVNIRPAHSVACSRFLGRLPGLRLESVLVGTYARPGIAGARRGWARRGGISESASESEWKRKSRPRRDSARV